jgi:hypothetical protein
MVGGTLTAGLFAVGTTLISAAFFKGRMTFKKGGIVATGSFAFFLALFALLRFWIRDDDRHGLHDFRPPIMVAQYVEYRVPPNHALQRTRPSRSGCNRSVLWAGSLSLSR